MNETSSVSNPLTRKLSSGSTSAKKKTRLNPNEEVDDIQSAYEETKLVEAAKQCLQARRSQEALILRRDEPGRIKKPNELEDPMYWDRKMGEAEKSCHQAIFNLGMLIWKGPMQESPDQQRERTVHKELWIASGGTGTIICNPSINIKEMAMDVCPRTRSWMRIHGNVDEMIIKEGGKADRVKEIMDGLFQSQTDDYTSCGTMESVGDDSNKSVEDLIEMAVEKRLRSMNATGTPTKITVDHGLRNADPDMMMTMSTSSVQFSNIQTKMDTHVSSTINGEVAQLDFMNEEVLQVVRVALLSDRNKLLQQKHLTKDQAVELVKVENYQLLRQWMIKNLTMRETKDFLLKEVYDDFKVDKTSTTATYETYVQQLKIDPSFKLFKPTERSKIHALCVSLLKHKEKLSALEPSKSGDVDYELIRILTEGAAKAARNTGPNIAWCAMFDSSKEKVPRSLELFIQHMMEHVNAVEKCMQTLAVYNGSPVELEQKSDVAKEATVKPIGFKAAKQVDAGQKKAAQQPSKKEMKRSRGECNACGRSGHLWEECQIRLGKHPNHNTDKNMKWKDSAWGKKFLAKEKPSEVCPRSYTIDGEAFVIAGDPNRPAKGVAKKPFIKKGERSYNTTMQCMEKTPRFLDDLQPNQDYVARRQDVSKNINEVHKAPLIPESKLPAASAESAWPSSNSQLMRTGLGSDNREAYLAFHPDIEDGTIQGKLRVPCSQSIMQCSDLQRPVLTLQLCLDPKASPGSYVGTEAAAWFRQNGGVVNRKDTPTVLETAVSGGSNHEISEVLNAELLVMNPETGKEEVILLNLAVIDSKRYDVIVGRQHIRQHPILYKLFTLGFGPLRTEETEATRRANKFSMVTTADENLWFAERRAAVSSLLAQEAAAYAKVRECTVCTLCKPAVGNNNLEERPSDSRVSADEVLLTEEVSIIPAKEMTDAEILALLDIQGDDREFIDQQMEIARANIRSFSATLNKQPADIPAMKLTVDETKWYSRGNQCAPRNQSPQKFKDMMMQVTKMVPAQVIRISEASAHSQVLMTPKPDGEYRFCVDFRNLNDASTAHGWPIPNIKQMLERLGAQRAKYYAVLDLTKGYYQAPLHEESRKYTAFITPQGLYEWCRVPMGLKGAPGYFQQQLATYVLRNLLYVRCELFLDDIIIWGVNKEDYLGNLRAVLERLGEHRLTINPKKCRMGLSRVEYVGHIIDSTGIDFSDEKKQEVIEWIKPVFQKQLKSFIGLANYFRDHVQDMATLMHPLLQLCKQYQRGTRVEWNEAADKAFDIVRDKIKNLPKLWFISDDPKDTIHLFTDASDVGMGAHLTQERCENGVTKEYPIQFMSKSFDQVQRRWSVPEREGYAIYASIKKFEYLLCDRKFILHTDHANLTYIRDSGSPKVIRWKLAIQEFDFQYSFIQGTKNVVADFFSRNIDYSGIPEDEICLLEAYEVPEQYRVLLDQFHNTLTGHHGVDRTLDKLREAGHQWSTMRTDVRSHIRCCAACQKMSTLKIPIITRKYTVSSYSPMETVAMDSIGPFPTDKFGNQYVHVMFDCFSRFVELMPTKSATAKEAAYAMLQHFGRYGLPGRILTDGGSQYRNDLIKELCTYLNIEKLETQAHSHQENSTIERANKEIVRHLKNILYDTRVKDNWSDVIPLVQRIYNSAKNESIGCSPAQILFGNSVNLDRGIIFKAMNNDETLATNHNLSECLDIMLKNQQAVIAVAAEELKIHAILHTGLNEQRQNTVFPINSYVLIQHPPTIYGDGRSNKLELHNKGPYRVINCDSTGTKYTVQNLVTNKNENVSVYRLKRYYHHQYDNIEQAALRDNNSYIVEKIVACKGPTSRKSQMKFHVKWLGFDELTWEPWANVRTNEQLHEFLREQGMEKLIPNNFNNNDD